MKNWCVRLILLILPLSMKAQVTDTLSLGPALHSWNFETALYGDLSQGGYSTAFIGMARWQRIGIAAGGKMIVNKAYLLREAPAGIVTGLYFFPNGEGQRFTAFMNLDYQATFNSENDVLQSLFRPGNVMHEYTAGYGFRCNLGKHVRMISAVNIGRYTEVLYNPVMNKRTMYSGFNTLVRLGINYTIMR